MPLDGPNFGMDPIFWSTTNQVAVCELSCISNRPLRQTRAPRHVVEQAGSSLTVKGNWTCAQTKITLHCTRRRLRSQATEPLRSSDVMTTAPNAAPKNIAATASILLANLGLVPFASEESAPMPVIVRVRTVVVRSGIASFWTPAFPVPIASAVKAVRAKG
jgi:hypothetical protein